MSDDANSAFAFWTAPIGGFVLAVALTLPVECTGSILDDTYECTNLLGFQTLVLDQAQSWILGILVGAACWGLVKAFEYFTGP